MGYCEATYLHLGTRETNHVFPKYSGGTGIGKIFPFQKRDIGKKGWVMNSKLSPDQKTNSMKS